MAIITGGSQNVTINGKPAPRLGDSTTGISSINGISPGLDGSISLTAADVGAIANTVSVFDPTANNTISGYWAFSNPLKVQGANVLTYNSSVQWNKIASTPTTLAGYGITDAASANGSGASGTWSISITGNANNANHATTANTADVSLTANNASYLNGQAGAYYLDFTNATNTTNVVLTNTTQTITGVKTFDGNVVFNGANVYFSNQITAAGFKGNLAWSYVTSTPTTLAGYGITDAALANNVVDLSSNQTIAGIKTFASSIVASITGTANNSTYLGGQLPAYYHAWSNLTGVPTTFAGFGLNTQTSNGTANGLMSSTDYTKLSGIEAGADVTATHTANNTTYFNGQLPAYYLNYTNLSNTGNVVTVDTTQTIIGTKTFSNTIVGSINGTSNNSTHFGGQLPSFYANTDHKYHSFVNGEYFWDSYQGSNYFRIFTENSKSDITRFGAISNVEYYDHASNTWVAWDAGNTVVETLLDGREDTATTLDHTHRTFRFNVHKSTGYPSQTLIVWQCNWQFTSATNVAISMESFSSNTYTLKDTANFTAEYQSPSGWGVYTYATGQLHDGATTMRVTIDVDDWANNTVGNNVYSTIQPVRFMVLSNYLGRSLQPFQWNYARDVSFEANVSSNGYVTAKTFTGNLAWSYITGTPNSIDGYGIANSTVLGAIRQVTGTGVASGLRSQFVSVIDTRAVVNVPSDFFSNTPKTAQYEFKSVSSVNNPTVTASNNYAYVSTITGLGDPSGGYPVQVSYGDGLSVRLALSNTTWGPWRTMWHDGNFTPSDYAYANGSNASGTWSISITGSANNSTHFNGQAASYYLAWNNFTGVPTTFAGFGLSTQTANGTSNGLMSSTDYTKLSGIQSGAQVNVPTNLGENSNSTVVTITSSTGTQADILSANSTAAGVLVAADKSKLDGIEALADVTATHKANNSTYFGGQLPAYYLAWSNLTGVPTTFAGFGLSTQTANATANGLMSNTDYSKLAGIANGAQVNVPTNLGESANATTLTITSSTGTNVTLQGANSSTSGVFTAADKSKLDGIEALADVTATHTANNSTYLGGQLPAYYLDYNNFTNTTNVVTTNTTQTITGVKNLTGTITIKPSGYLSANASGAIRIDDYNGGLRFTSFSNTGQHYIHGPFGGGDHLLEITRSGNSSYTYTFFGLVNAPDFQVTSDRNLKTNVHPLAFAESRRVLDIEAVTYDLKSGWVKDKAGVIAQQLIKIGLERYVSVNPDTGYMTVSYQSLVVPLIQVVQDQEARIKRLEEIVEKLSNGSQ